MFCKIQNERKFRFFEFLTEEILRKYCSKRVKFPFQSLKIGVKTCLCALRSIKLGLNGCLITYSHFSQVSSLAVHTNKFLLQFLGFGMETWPFRAIFPQYFRSVKFKRIAIFFHFVFCKTCSNFLESCANRILRPDSERTRSQLSESGLRIVLAILSRNWDLFAKKMWFIVTNPYPRVSLCVPAWVCASPCESVSLRESACASLCVPVWVCVSLCESVCPRVSLYVLCEFVCLQVWVCVSSRESVRLRVSVYVPAWVCVCESVSPRVSVCPRVSLCVPMWVWVSRVSLCVSKCESVCPVWVRVSHVSLCPRVTLCVRVSLSVSACESVYVRVSLCVSVCESVCPVWVCVFRVSLCVSMWVYVSWGNTKPNFSYFEAPRLSLRANEVQSFHTLITSVLPEGKSSLKFSVLGGTSALLEGKWSPIFSYFESPRLSLRNAETNFFVLWITSAQAESFRALNHLCSPWGQMRSKLFVLWITSALLKRNFWFWRGIAIESAPSDLSAHCTFFKLFFMYDGPRKTVQKSTHKISRS